MRRRVFVVTAGLAGALLLPRLAPAEEKIGVAGHVRLPDMHVGAESLARFPGFSKTELVSADFAPGSALLNVNFPGHAYADGALDGRATVGVMLEADGQPADFLVLSYTEAYFADALLREAQEYKFAPRRVRGVAVPGPFAFTYLFVAPPGSANLSSFDAIKQRQKMIEGGARLRYEPHLEDETDAGHLQQIRLSVPEIPAGYTEGASPKVLVSFYVDEDGRVRLPNVESAPSTDLIAPAIAAVRRWRFAPPTRKHLGVLIFTMRTLGFKPPAVPAAGANPAPAPR